MDETRKKTEVERVFRRIRGVAFLLLLSSASAVAADLKIKDSRGTEVLVTNASIDYSSFMASDKETQGIRLLQGDGMVTVKWADIESLTFVRTDDSVRPPRIELEVVLRSGKKAPAALVRQGQMKLLGKTDLGDYSIDLQKVRTITPIR
ncbi:hypothetical protein [Luteitalea pratensis]|uniref:hypothetical protein n=1 Tax=Luteitalea pratensis TaxID=1855912 RepID=UPI000D72FA39|nr:hypothetical protein [Luteitalea pratensis]